MNSQEEQEIYLMENEDNLIYTINQLEIGELVSCENCGNIWDGHAQCNCWQWNEIFSDSYNSDDGYTDSENFTDSDDCDSDFDPVIYGGDPLAY
jgi:hypothetical protein